VAARPKWPRGQNFGIGIGLGLKALASASALASNIWPRPDLGLHSAEEPAAKKTDRSVCRLLGHHSMIEDKLLCERE